MEETGMQDSPTHFALSSAEQQALGSRVYCDDRLGFRWAALAQLPHVQELARLNARNEAMLRALTMLEEHDESQVEDAKRAELHRLEGKVDLMLELLSELVRERHSGGATITMRFSSEGLCWWAGSAESIGSLLMTEWHLLPSWPVALKLPVRVLTCRAEAGQHLICAEFVALNDPVRDWLEKLVFRRHRRAIAQQRTTRAGGRPQAGAPEDG